MFCRFVVYVVVAMFLIISAMIIGLNAIADPLAYLIKHCTRGYWLLLMFKPNGVDKTPGDLAGGVVVWSLIIRWNHCVNLRGLDYVYFQITQQHSHLSNMISMACAFLKLKIRGVD